MRLVWGPWGRSRETALRRADTVRPPDRGMAMNERVSDSHSAGLLQALGLERRHVGDGRDSAWDTMRFWRWWRRRSVDLRRALIRGIVMTAAVALGFWGFQSVCALDKVNTCKPDEWYSIY